MPDYNYTETIFVNGVGGSANDAYKDIRFQVQSAYQVGVICSESTGQQEIETKEAFDTSINNLLDFYTGCEEDDTISFTLQYKDQVQSCKSANVANRLEMLESLMVQVNSQIS